MSVQIQWSDGWGQILCRWVLLYKQLLYNISLICRILNFVSSVTNTIIIIANDFENICSK